MGILIAALILLIPPDGVIHHDGETVSAQEMLDMLRDVQVVFIGEKHDDVLAHEWELFIWENLASEDRFLALEMFETDVQEMLDGYISGDIELDDFLESSRPWSNYLEAYHPMVSYAALNGMRVIAANVPRHFASSVARHGWEGLREAPDADFFEVISIDSTNDSYRQRFLETMEALMGEMHNMPMDPLNMYRAQLLKDAVMASSIKDVSCVFICGSYHSDFHSGIPDQLDPGVPYMTVSIIYEDDPWNSDQADFVITR